MPNLEFKKLLVFVTALGSIAGLSSCGSSVSVAALQPTLTFQLVDGGRVATQAGQPVPSFSYQPRPRVELGEGWRFEPADLSPVLTFATRSRETVRDLETEAAGRQKAGFDDATWQPIDVPGSTSPPPGGHPTDGWYRDTFTVPPDWSGQAVTLKFGSVNYLSDVWLNGVYLGYHEGGVTPFAFSPGKALVSGTNTLAVRVYDPPKGARIDVLPWYYNDAWEYEGITGPVWLEAAHPLHVVRADVVPYLDAADVSVVLQNSSEASYSNVSLDVEVLPAAVTASNLLDPNPVSLIPKDAQTIATQAIDGITLNANAVAVREGNFVFSGADHWTVLHPALYVLGVHVLSNGIVVDSFYDTFGLRRIQVDPTAPRLLLNGDPIAFTGVAVQDERVAPAVNGAPRGGTPGSPDDELRIARQAQSVNADLLRTNHVPGNPALLMLADRLGLGVWEEIPMNHFTPETFTYVMQRGIAQQMLAEMDLRDFNRPSVMFHAFANESTGVNERAAAMQALHDLDRKIDGTRLTAQAMYGSDPTDPTSSPLDVAGYTFYYGVFYGGRSPEPGTLRALQQAHRMYPHKPVMVLEFGQWVYDNGYDGQQGVVFSKTWPALLAHLDTAQDGYIGAAVWWSLNDYWTDVAGIGVERFGLYAPDGKLRRVGHLAQASFGEVTVPTGTAPGFTSGGSGAAEPVTEPAHILMHLGYALLFPVVLVALIVAAMVAARRTRRLRGAT
ncbi:MAG TPA: glycoside hydrolase family 2 TIM barrel-domain containing protein [Candidatus Dormibacteraeota bacterium]|nr:glycoside hydrolase family 2 TIM barrel-domain containing protein [Candidatus Dormibacteraeota bacterium]